MNKPELELYIGDFSVVLNLQKTALMLRCQLVEHTQNGPQLAGKYMHLTMTTELAMDLLAALQTMQKTHDLKLSDVLIETGAVPPEKDRH